MKLYKICQYIDIFNIIFNSSGVKIFLFLILFISYSEKSYWDQLQPPLERAVYWTEYVIRHGGATHLRSLEIRSQTSDLDILIILNLMLCIHLVCKTFLVLLTYQKIFLVNFFGSFLVNILQRNFLRKWNVIKCLMFFFCLVFQTKNEVIYST